MIKAKKSFGQNFLKDSNIIDKIVNSIPVTEDDLIIEIGPGMGALTKMLKSKNANLIAFEIDERMHEFLDILEDNKTKIIYEDILKVDLNSIISSYNYNKLYVIANLPYYITTPIIEKLIEINCKIDEMTVMVQNEVADRFSARPCSKEYGMMTVYINLKYYVDKLFIVKNTCFNPIPKVDSAVVNFKLKDNFDSKIDIEKFRNFISVAFSHKRKTLKNNIGSERFNSIKSVLEKYHYSDNVRAEEICLEAYIDICNKLYN